MPQPSRNGPSVCHRRRSSSPHRRNRPFVVPTSARTPIALPPYSGTRSGTRSGEYIYVGGRVALSRCRHLWGSHSSTRKIPAPTVGLAPHSWRRQRLAKRSNGRSNQPRNARQRWKGRRNHNPRVGASPSSGMGRLTATRGPVSRGTVRPRPGWTIRSARLRRGRRRGVRGHGHGAAESRRVGSGPALSQSRIPL